MNEYRIKEYLGSYTIQKKIETTTKRLFSKSVHEIEWLNINIVGKVSNTRYLPLPPMTFDSLTEAKTKIKELKKGIVYHNE